MMKLKNSPFLRHFTVISFVSVIILNISVMEFGFDNSVFSLIQAMDGTSGQQSHRREAPRLT